MHHRAQVNQLRQLASDSKGVLLAADLNNRWFDHGVMLGLVDLVEADQCGFQPVARHAPRTPRCSVSAFD